MFFKTILPIFEYLTLKNWLIAYIIMEHITREKIEGIQSIARTNEQGFRELFICELDRYCNIKIYWNPESIENDDSYYINSADVKNAIYRDYREDYREDDILDFPDSEIERYAIHIITSSKKPWEVLRPIETTRLPKYSI